MKPLIVLISVFVVGLFVIKLRTKKTNWKLAGRIAMSAMLMFTAVAHFIFTDGMAKMIPDFFPLKKELVYLTGILEMLFAVGLLIPRTKTIISWTLILFFLTVLPANIKASLEHINYQTGELDGNGIEYLWFRIPLQILFIAWVFFTAIKDYETNSTNE
ncbi:hypothetical protein RBH94_13560 [Aestuariibaculum sp. YM273]|uniref:DoxX family protein n=1 Tax=Aestuariibaculum sp. YM273 TaxID=3070659 RepID=UPI0027DB9A1F|nr:hypothetical protein [Aestuariibaculum sp. YM273]WMI65080.1 hypothetical protein RBH94_13560 [Aestuariibaculum sp. YM273]